MLSTIESINSAVNNFIWGVPAMICIIGVGLYLTIRTNFLQIRKFPYAIKTTIGRMFRKKDASDGSLTPFQAVCTALAATVGTESKFKVYISALTQLNIDEHNRTPTTDGRMIRRIVRDNRTRGTSAKATIAMWPSVRRGEDENIFPYQEQADAMFNSALLYELAVLKLYAEPVLFQIGPDEPEYQEAKRLLKFLDYFVGIPSEDIPKNSILREFVGGSCFDV